MPQTSSLIVAKTVLEGIAEVITRGTSGYSTANGIFINTTSAPSAFERARIECNVIDDNGGDGILLNFSSAVSVSNNELSYNAVDGIELIGSTANHISRNQADHNGLSTPACGPSEGPGNCTGIRVHSDSTGNSFDRNKAFHNLVWDAQDNTSGTETAGTANQWDDKRCEKRSPSGICKY